MVKSACGIEAVHICFNGTGIWSGETMKMNIAAILDFVFQIDSFISNTLCHQKYVILSSTCLAVYL